MTDAEEWWDGMSDRQKNDVWLENYVKHQSLDAASCSPFCDCGEDSTGWTEIKCCNICGMPHKDETCPWHIVLSTPQKVAAMNDLIFNEADYEQLALIAAACVQQMVNRCKANAEPTDQP